MSLLSINYPALDCELETIKSDVYDLLNTGVFSSVEMAIVAACDAAIDRLVQSGELVDEEGLELELASDYLYTSIDQYEFKELMDAQDYVNKMGELGAVGLSQADFL